ncbi:type VII secretion protein EccB [Jidongwangia harbinensis]|uniref:type VII secretion protein EccB n=1 Tax=Jidongwangia harbinensis TaxID=2878561 RepID=UPI001CD9B086|nr:type VII secretion protein EccB [Jidongwangia harbinensis]MCA2217460.1 type VII secretion protein EccB [Jidongwangia harbinensis]
MQTQRDHVHAHTFMMGRLSSALVEGDPTSAEIPGRRALTGTLLGILVVVLVAAGFAVYGWIVPGGSKAFRQAGAILVEKETGNRYVYFGGKLHPAPNLTSAMLVQGPAAKVKLISRNSLAKVPRGPAIGIRDAPQTVPAAGDMLSGPWLTCLPGSVVDLPGDGLGINFDPRAASEPLPADRFSVVRGGGHTYVVALGRKFRVGGDAVLVALGAANVRPVPAPRKWLDWLATGPELEPAKIPGAGSTGPEVGGRRHPVGTLFRQRPAAGDEQLFVLRGDGLAPMSRTEFLLADADRGGEPVELDAAAVVDAPRSTDRSLTSRLPELVGLHWQDPGDRVLCLRQQPVGRDAFGSMPVLTTRDQSAVDGEGRPFVSIPPRTGMVVTPVPQVSKLQVEAHLISDEGIAYHLLDRDAAVALKLDKANLVPFPRSLLAALPQGPLLSHAASIGGGGR